MNTKIETVTETGLPHTATQVRRLYNPEAYDFNQPHRVKCIELTDRYTRIDFIYRSPTLYVNGGWIEIDKGAYIQPVDSSVKYGMVAAINIPVAPVKHYFTRQGEYHVYTLVYGALPKGVSKINIIEKEAPGTYFNFYDVDFANWMTVPHPTDLPMQNN
jgi:hypothetical protein